MYFSFHIHMFMSDIKVLCCLKGCFQFVRRNIEFKKYFTEIASYKSRSNILRQLYRFFFNPFQVLFEIFKKRWILSKTIWSIKITMGWKISLHLFKRLRETHFTNQKKKLVQEKYISPFERLKEKHTHLQITHIEIDFAFVMDERETDNSVLF